MILWLGSLFLGVILAYIINHFLLKAKSGQKNFPPLVKRIENDASAHEKFVKNPTSFLRENLKTHGEIFTIEMKKGLFQTYLFDVQNIHHILHSKKTDFLPISAQSKQRFGLKKSLNHLDLFTKVLKQALSISNVHELFLRFEQNLCNYLTALPSTPTLMKLLNDFVCKTVLKAAVDTLFGKSVYYDNLGEDFLDYNNSMSPRVAGSNPDTADSGKRAKEKLKVALSTSIPGIYEQNKFLQIVKRDFVDVVLNDVEDREEEIDLLLLLLWGAFNNSLATSFWIIAHVVGSTEARSTILDETDVIFETGKGSVAENLKSLPKTRAIIQEVFRIRARPSILRFAMEDIDLEISGKMVTIPKGHWISLFPKLLYEDEQVFQEANRFHFNRFFPDKDGRSPTFFMNEKEIPERIIRSLLVFGDGRFRCPAYDFMGGILKIMVAVIVQNINMTIMQQIPESLVESVSSVPGPATDVEIFLSKAK